MWGVIQLAGVLCGDDPASRDVVQSLGSAAVIVGGMDMMSQAVMLAKKPHIVIGEWADGLEEGLGRDGWGVGWRDRVWWTEWVVKVG